MHDVVVAGGGVVGLSIARQAALQGASVLVLNRGGPEDAASWAAAGMLAPQSEAASADPLFELCMSSLRLYKDWVDHLRDESGVDPEYDAPGLLLVACSQDALDALTQRVSWQRGGGLNAQILTPQEVRRLEPRLALPLQGAVLLPEEHQVTPRALLRALRAACVTQRVEIRDGQQVEQVISQAGCVEAVRTSGGMVSARCVIVASGVGSARIEGLSPLIPVLPRKGQIFSLTVPSPLFTRMIRWEQAYAVTRPGGNLVIGATDEDTGFDRSITPQGIGRLLAASQQLAPQIGSLPIQEIWTGLRPATPDKLPVIGKSSIEGLFYATGHYRNGILLAPVTAAVVGALIANSTPAVPLEPFSPSRFAV